MAHPSSEADSPAAKRSHNPAKGWAASTLQSLQFSDYRLIWIGSLLAFTAFHMMIMAQSVVAFDLTGDNRSVGAVFFGLGIAMLLLNPFGGAVADRFSKRFLVIVTHIVIGTVALLTAVLLLLDALNVFFLASGAFVLGSMFAFLGPARTALAGDAVASEHVGNAMALLQVAQSVARVGGPFIGGALLAWSLVGAAGTFLFIASIFIFVIAAFSRLPPSKPRRNIHETSVLIDVRLGIRHIAERPALLHTVTSFHIVTILGMVYMVLMPGFAKDVLHTGTAGIGVMFGVAAAGGLVLSLAVASLADSHRASLFMSLSGLGLGLSLILLGLAPSFELALLVMVLVGGATGAFHTLSNALAMRLTSIEFFGRVIGLVYLSWGLNALMSLPYGLLADVIGERAVLSGVGAVLSFVVVILFLWSQRIKSGDRAPATRVEQTTPAPSA